MAYIVSYCSLSYPTAWQTNPLQLLSAEKEAEGPQILSPETRAINRLIQLTFETNGAKIQSGLSSICFIHVFPLSCDDHSRTYTSNIEVSIDH